MDAPVMESPAVEAAVEALPVEALPVEAQAVEAQAVEAQAVEALAVEAPAVEVPATNGAANGAVTSNAVTNGAAPITVNGASVPNGTNGVTAPAQTQAPSASALQNTVIENMRPLRVVVIGAGFAGILAAIRIPERLRNVDLTVYEKNDGVGGVWWANRYAGVACDIPSHSYQYTFSPNARWSNLYSPGAHIQKYLQDTAERFGAMRFIKTRHEVKTATWDETTKKWNIQVVDLVTGREFIDVVDFIVSGRGLLSKPAWPKLPGLKDFKGKLLHSAAWDESYDFKNKKIGVIGNGSSGIQIIPSLQREEGADLKCFMRSRTWISASFGESSMVELGYPATKTTFTEEEREALANDPAAYLKFRKVIEDGGNAIHDSTILGSEMQRAWSAAFEQSMREKLSKKPHLLDGILPSFAPGCRRLTPGPGFLESLQEDNVEVIRDPITAVTETGVKLESGREIELDTLVCATGFDVDGPPLFELVGRGGQTLTERWADTPETYLSVAVDGFPNFQMVLGPNSAIGFGSLTVILEAQVDYITKVIRKLQRENYASIEVKAERVHDFTRYVDAYFADKVYMDECQSWYRSKSTKGDRIIALWPGSTLHALEALRSPRWEDYVYESREGLGGLAWLGNGWSITQTEGDMSWYLNPDEVEVPMEGKPEERPRLKARPWGY